jgi:protoporphyrinogen oxidase
VNSELKANLFSDNYNDTSSHSRNISVVIYEPSPRIGGSLLTAMKSFSFLDKGASFHAEMGDMSYISLQHRGLVDFITEVLNLETEKVPEEDSAESQRFL